MYAKIQTEPLAFFLAEKTYNKNYEEKPCRFYPNFSFGKKFS